MFPTTFARRVIRKGNFPVHSRSTSFFCSTRFSHNSAMSEGRVEYTFLWFIENYSYCPHKAGERLLSPYFTADGLEGTYWLISFYPRGERDKDGGYTSVFLHGPALVEEAEEISLHFELSFLTGNGSLVCSKEGCTTFGDELKNSGHGWKKFVLMSLFPHDVLIVRFRIWKGEGKIHKFAPTCARTRIAVENILLFHVVENFSTLEPNQKKTIESRSESKEGVVLSSSLYFTGDSRFGEAMIIEITPSDSNYILSKGKVSLIDASGNIIACGEKDNRCDGQREDIQKLSLSLTRQVILSKKDEYLPDDKLSLVCECSFSIGRVFNKIEEIQHDTSTTALKLVSNPVSRLKSYNTLAETSAHPGVCEDMKALYLNQRLTDVELTTKSKSFPAHKNILCARSPVFDTMMTKDMKEKYNNCIEIEDLGDDVVQQMLLFLYSDTIENLQWENATQLYYAGDKYQIGKLKTICSSFLVENLTATNASRLLILADTHSDSDLKKSVEEFILEHEEEVFGSKEWEVLIEKNPTLASKTMHLKYKIKK